MTHPRHTSPSSSPSSAPSGSATQKARHDTKVTMPPVAPSPSADTTATRDGSLQTAGNDSQGLGINSPATGINSPATGTNSPAADSPTASADVASAPSSIVCAGPAQDMAAAKVALRREMLQRRRGLDTTEAQRHGAMAQAALLAHPAWITARQVVLYVAVRNELDTDLLLREAWEAGKEVLLPRCDPACSGVMCLAPCLCAADLAPGSHGIPEPSPLRCPPVDPQSPTFTPDLAVIPGVAFDRQGNRLGYGGGYYDRFLSTPGMSATPLVGFAHAFQIVDVLPAEAWDRPVNALCTEEGLIWL